MRTNIVIDDKLMAEAIKVTGASTKKEAVELGLKALVTGMNTHRDNLRKN